MHSIEIRDYIRENKNLFWYVPEQDKIHISLESLVESILNYGDEESVKKLFDIVGINKVSDIFYSHISGERVNYFPEVVNYFKLYFQRHAQRNTNIQSK